MGGRQAVENSPKGKPPKDSSWQEGPDFAVKNCKIVINYDGELSAVAAVLPNQSIFPIIVQDEPVFNRFFSSLRQKKPVLNAEGVS